MSFNAVPSGQPAANAERIASAVRYLRQGKDAQAFLLLSEPGTEKDPAARFALGLCHLRADELPMAISSFEQALTLLKAATAKLWPGETNTVYLKLAAKQIENKNYLAPMDADFCALFPKAAEQNVLLAMIDAYQASGMPEQAERLSAGLTGSVFEEYKKQLKECD